MHCTFNDFDGNVQQLCSQIGARRLDYKRTLIRQIAWAVGGMAQVFRKDLSMINFNFRRRAAVSLSAVSAIAVLAVLSASISSVVSIAPASAETAKLLKHKIRSAHFVVTALTKKGFKVDGVRRKAQVYFVKVGQGGSTAILAVDGYSAEIIGLKLLTAGAGTTPKKRGSGPRRFIDATYEFGYIIRESVYESYTVISSTEISSTEEYSFVSYSESEEVTYEEVEHDASADLDDGTAEDTAGDTEAGANNDKDDGAADDSYNTNDNAGEDNSASDDAGASDDGAANDDSGATDDASDDSSGNDDGGGSDDSGGNDDGGDDGGGDDGGGNDDGGGDDGGGDDGGGDDG